MRHILLAALAIGMAAVLWFSERPWALTNMPGVELVETLPAHADQAKLRRFMDYSGIIIPRPGPTVTRETPPALGYSYRELSLMRFPVLAYADQGYVLFVDGPQGTQMVPLDADYMKLLEKEAGRPLGKGYIFPYHRHLWGWLFVIGFIAWFVLQRRAEDRRRIAMGML